jgi:hypothetical protein
LRNDSIVPQASRLSVSADPARFELVVSGVTGRRVRPLHYGSKWCRLCILVEAARQAGWYHRVGDGVNRRVGVTRLPPVGCLATLGREDRVRGHLLGAW